MYLLRYKLFISLLVIQFLSLSTYAQKKEVLLIGSFHFANPGLDASKLKSLDINSNSVQKDINTIVAAIKKFKPSKIFVEYRFQDQQKLNDIYTDFLNNKSTTGINEKSEIYQLGFKSGKALGLSQIEAIDYKANLSGTDSVMKVMQATNQEQLMQAIPEYVQAISGNFNGLVKDGASIIEILLAQNTKNSRNLDLGFYTNLLTKAGNKDNFIGADVATQWYRRNINMFSLIQKSLTENDQKIMILLGASHIAVLEKLFELNPEYSIVELKDVLKK